MLWEGRRKAGSFLEVLRQAWTDRRQVACGAHHGRSFLSCLVSARRCHQKVLAWMPYEHSQALPGKPGDGFGRGWRICGQMEASGRRWRSSGPRDALGMGTPQGTIVGRWIASELGNSSQLV